jgi:LDH2 family malate/lactate/ureidoglycolate dehydrogenase
MSTYDANYVRFEAAAHRKEVLESQLREIAENCIVADLNGNSSVRYKGTPELIKALKKGGYGVEHYGSTETIIITWR